MMDQKRIPCTVQQSAQSSLMPKRQKGDISISSKDSKERLGEKIIALQQLVSPYGKTDTASVLSEASQYIQFLHEQVKVLSAPYLQSGPAADQLQGLESCSLRSRGLCLVPASCTAGVAGTNGADMWAPMKCTSPKLDKAICHYN
ncbi:hypothetical protein SAY87_011416 [Trapa incisa]|uniref:BHLH domain-containing protein n=2 Tax=Trapa TaxID=22665 RepID=A0AAN7R6J0_TRANT|nr:hypothetical protein SAY87_011416 [Trapa incisa]KAK4793894.1 hypothetical protein SAY86_011888 [Trapa natans]